jgi:hypothetical protein
VKIKVKEAGNKSNTEQIFIIFFFFFSKFCDVACCTRNHPEGDLATSGYRPAMKTKID